MIIAKKIFKKHYLFFLLIPIVIISQIYLLAPHLQMGLNDLDEGYTVDFLYVRSQNPNLLNFILTTYQRWGAVYLHQYYYPGILNYFFGDYVVGYHIASHIFKMLGIISLYAFFFIITESPPIAFLSAILYGFSYATVGSFDSVAQSSDFPAIIVLSVFLSLYFYLVKRNIADFTKVIFALLLLFTSLIFSTERIYPIVPLILFTEIGSVLMNKSKQNIKIVLKRGGILLSPILLAAILQPRIILGMLQPSWKDLIHRVTTSQPELILIPYLSFATTFLPGSFWGIRTQILPMTVMIAVLLISAFILSKKPYRFILTTLLIWIFGAFFVYTISRDAPYFVNFGKVALAGFYILGLTFAFLLEWIETKNKLIFGLFFGPFASFIFVMSVWIGTGDRTTFFMDSHRYLTAASIFSSLFLGTFIVSFCKKLITNKLAALRFIPLLLIFPIISADIHVIGNYFQDKLTHGLARADQIYMRQQFLPYYQNIDPNNHKLFYMDTSTDSKNNAVYGNTLYAGYNAWPIWWPHLKKYHMEDIPVIVVDLNAVKSSVVYNNGQPVEIYYGERHYKLENFYAFMLIDRKVIDITTEVKKGFIKN